MSVAGILSRSSTDETGLDLGRSGRRALAAIEEQLGAACSPASTRGSPIRKISAPTSAFCRTASKRSMLTVPRANFPSRRVASGLRAHGDSPLSVRMTYPCATDSEGVQRHGLFCDAREGELSSLPRFWGHPTRPSSTKACLAKGDACAPTWWTWKLFTSPGVPTSAGNTGAALSAGAVAMSAVDLRDWHRGWIGRCAGRRHRSPLQPLNRTRRGEDARKASESRRSNAGSRLAANPRRPPDLSAPGPRRK